MRTILAIDDDVPAAAKHLAQREQRSIGEIISALARRGLARGEQSDQWVRNGIPLLPGRGDGSSPVTLSLVNELRDELP